MMRFLNLATQHPVTVQDVATTLPLKRSVDSGVSSFDLLSKLHPKICKNCPCLVHTQSHAKETPEQMTLNDDG